MLKWRDTMKFCGNCGASMEVTDQFCGSCGEVAGTNNRNNYDGSHGDIATAGGVKSDTYKTSLDNPKDNNKGKTLKILAWIFLFPFMLIYTFFKTEKINKWVKVPVAVFFILALFFGEDGIINLNSRLTTNLIFAAIIGSIVGYTIDKKKRKIEQENESKVREEENKRRMEETQRFQAEQDKEVNQVIRIMNLVFSGKGFSDKIDSFILQHTKRYDFGEIGTGVYSNSLNLLRDYVNKNIDYKDSIPDIEENKDLIEYLSSKPKMTIDLSNIERYINDRKMYIYSEEMKKRLRDISTLPLEEIANQYLDIYGEKGLKVLNISILSKALDEDISDITPIVRREYEKKLEEYEKKRIEAQLFNLASSIRNIEYVDKLSGFEFEDFLKDLFTSFGYKSEELPYTNDYGADLIINKGFNKIVIQAKNYAGSVGNKAVQEAVAAKAHYKCDTAMVISNAYFTQNAVVTAESSDVLLIDRDKLSKILEEGEMYFNSLVS